MKSFLLAVSLVVSVCASAQKNVILTIQHKLGNQNFSYNLTNSNNVGSTFKFSRVEYYLSGFTVIHDGGQETAVSEDVYVLTDAFMNVVQSLGSLDITNVEGIKFHIGVDAPTNNEDPNQWPLNHPLAPQSPSMHWGWAAGYFFAVADGVAGPGLNTGFEIHSLGNVNYFEQTVTVAGENVNDNVYINIEADYLEAVKDINLNAGPIDHGAFASDQTLIENFRDHVFSAASSSPLKIESHTAQALQVFPNPSNGVFYFQTSQPAESIELFDLTGRKVSSTFNKLAGLQQLEMDQTGVYLLVVRLQNQTVLRQKLVVE